MRGNNDEAFHVVIEIEAALFRGGAQGERSHEDDSQENSNDGESQEHVQRGGRRTMSSGLAVA